MIPPQTRDTIKDATYLGKRLGDMKGDELWEAIAGMVNYFKWWNDMKRKDYEFMADLAKHRP